MDGTEMRARAEQKLAGLYLVADLSMPAEKLLNAVSSAIKGGIQIVQIWNEEKATSKNRLELSREIRSKTTEEGIPLIINKDVELAQRIRADGVHFDDFDTRADDVRRMIGLNSIVGYTCGNDSTQLKRAEDHGADYISFCAVFPSPSVQSCEIVPLESVRRAKQTVPMPVFASGGITPQNAHLVMEAGADGLAIASSILRSDDPEKEARAFREVIDRYLHVRTAQ